MSKRTPRKSYKDVAERVLAAVRELNGALAEAHEHPQTRVHMSFPQHPTFPTQFGCEVTRITKHFIPAEGHGIKAWELHYKVAEKPEAPKKATKSSAKKAKKTGAKKAA